MRLIIKLRNYLEIYTESKNAKENSPFNPFFNLANSKRKWDEIFKKNLEQHNSSNIKNNVNNLMHATAIKLL